MLSRIKDQRKNENTTFPTPATGAPLGSGRGITTFTKLPVQVLVSTYIDKRLII